MVVTSERNGKLSRYKIGDKIQTVLSPDPLVVVSTEHGLCCSIRRCPAEHALRVFRRTAGDQVYVEPHEIGDFPDESPAAAPTYTFDEVPEYLKSRDQWVAWRLVQLYDKNDKPLPKKTKVPLDLDLRKFDATLGKGFTFDQVHSLYLRNFDGCGAMRVDGLGFSLGGGVIGADGDRVLDQDAGTISPWAEEMIFRIKGYTDVSPSNNGVKLFVRVDPDFMRDEGVHNRLNFPDKTQLEFYTCRRFFTITGRPLTLPGLANAMPPQDDAVRGWYESTFAEQIARAKQCDYVSREDALSRPASVDEERVLEAMRQASNWHRVEALLRGDTSAYTGESEADAALVTHVAFWGGPDPEFIESFMKRYGPYRKKWDSKRRDSTYLRSTIEKFMHLERYFQWTTNRDTEVARIVNAPKPEPVTQDEVTGDADQEGGDTGAEPATAKITGKPLVVTTNRQLSDLTAESIEAIRTANHPPRWFRRGGNTVRLVEEEDEDGNRTMVSQTVNRNAMMGILADCAEWKKVNAKGERSNCFPPKDLVDNVAGAADLGLPVLAGIVETPVFTASGALITRTGYDPDSRLWYRPGQGLADLAIPADPSPEEIAAARSLIVDDLFADFPFVDQPARANAVAVLLLYFVRHMIKGATPLHVSDAPANRTGKTLIFDLIATIWTGRRASTTAECHGDEEWNKTLTSLLMSSSPYIFIDNINYAVSSGALAAVLTTDRHKSRVLGSNRTVDLPVRCVFLATGNNPKFSNENAKRVVKFRMDAGVENPELRSGFKHPSIRSWVSENRTDLVRACLTLCSAWVAAGKPPGKYTMGGYEDYVRVVGGILDVAGVTGFLGNYLNDLSDLNSSDDGWGEVIAAWVRDLGGKPLTAGALAPFVESNNLLLNLLDGKTDRARVVQLGNALSRVVDRVIGPYKIVRSKTTDGKPKKDNHGSALYELVKVGDAPEPPPRVMVYHTGDLVRVKDVGIPLKIVAVHSLFYRCEIPYPNWTPPHGIKISNHTEPPTAAVEPDLVLEKIE